jgi:hypothetical protein
VHEADNQLFKIANPTINIIRFAGKLLVDAAYTFITQASMDKSAR